MPLDGSPKKFAQDVASGLVTVNRMMLKRYTPMDIQKMLQGLDGFAKEVRTQAVDTGDHEALKEKGMKSQRLNGALLVIRQYIKENKLGFAG